MGGGGPYAPKELGRVTRRRRPRQGSWTGEKRASITPALSLILALREVGAQVAQLVEHVTENHGVGGSIPPLGTITFPSAPILKMSVVRFLPRATCRLVLSGGPA